MKKLSFVKRVEVFIAQSKEQKGVKDVLVINGKVKLITEDDEEIMFNLTEADATELTTLSFAKRVEDFISQAKEQHGVKDIIVTNVKIKLITEDGESLMFNVSETDAE